jgi:glucosamine-6-phosphate deaminase
MSSLSPTTSRVEQLTVQIYPDLPHLVRDAVDRLQVYLQQQIAHQGTATIILASGSTQIDFLKAFTACDLDWTKITCFHLDEYLGIDPCHPASFQQYMRDLVADRVPVKFHFLDSGANDPIRECRRYGLLLREQPIDLCLLGIGDNGHIAFNDPLVADFADPEPVKIVRLAEKSRQQQVDVGFFAHIEAVPQYAMTLTIPSICRARQLYCLALGQRKAAIVRELLHQEIAATLPATVLRQQSQATLLLDAPAASLI